MDNAVDPRKAGQCYLPDLTRVNVIGSSGSGKSTFCGRLSKLVNAPHIEMDCLFHKPNWGQPTVEEFQETVFKALEPNRWVLDGNYHSKTYQVKWSRATAIIWLDMTLTRTFTQVFCRSMQRMTRGRELWPGTGNVETFGRAFFSRDSILLWALTSHHPVRQRYIALQKDREPFNRVPFVRLRGRKATERFLNRVAEAVER